MIMRTNHFITAALIGIALSFTDSYAGNLKLERNEVNVSSIQRNVPPRRAINSFIKQKYPGCRILDRDTDDGFVEIKIRHHGIEKIILFDGNAKWLHTLWEVRRNQLPERVIVGLKRAGFAYSDIDDNDNQLLETPRGRYFAVQVDCGRRDGMYLVSERGKVIRRYSDDRWNDGRIYFGGRFNKEWDDGEDHFDEGDDEWDNRHVKHHRRHSRDDEHDDGEDHFDEGDDEWDFIR